MMYIIFLLNEELTKNTRKPQNHRVAKILPRFVKRWIFDDF